MPNFALTERPIRNRAHIHPLLEIANSQARSVSYAFEFAFVAGGAVAEILPVGEV